MKTPDRCCQSFKEVKEAQNGEIKLQIETFFPMARKGNPLNLHLTKCICCLWIRNILHSCKITPTDQNQLIWKNTL